MRVLAHIRVTFLGELGEAGMERKTETLNLRVSPALKRLVRLAADKDHRTIANLIEVLVREHCARHGLSDAPDLTDRARS